jgi:hypothetical protein
MAKKLSISASNETVEKVHFGTNLQKPSVYMLSIINLVFLFLFGVEPLAKYFSKKILFRQAQRFG